MSEERTFQDFVGQELSIDDTVVHQVGGRYPGLRKGTIEGFTKMMVRVNFEPHRGFSMGTVSTVLPEKLVKYVKEE